MIRGIYGDQVEMFKGKQWVNVYREDPFNRAVYYCTAQVEDLKNCDDLEEFLLEPITEDGQPMSVKEACRCSQ